MPQKYFDCPDNIRRPIKECLEHCPRKEGRCMSLPYLTEVGYDRPFIKPSVTQCLNPTRLEYLKIKNDYAVNPLERAFALLGTRVHRRLEIVAKNIEQIIAEHKVEDRDTIGTLDLLEPDELNDGCWKLVDSKTWASYALAKQLGLKQDGEYDRLKTTLQLNGYRIKVEPLGFKISRLFVQAIVRDGGTFVAKNNGIQDKVLMIPVEIMPDNEVSEYFRLKSEALIEAINTNTLPSLCSNEDSWNFRRCKGFCDAMEFCPEGRKINKLNSIDKTNQVL